MRLTVQITSFDVLPPTRELAQAGGRAVSNAVKRHLVERDARGRTDGLPRTGYWGDAAGSVTTELDGNVAVVSIPKEGAALHYYGGVVYPTGGRKALAIAKSAAAAGRRPAELDPTRERLTLIWPKGESAGTLRDKKSGEVFYLLVAKATIKEDPSVLPGDDALYDAANAAMFAAMEALR